ncbi:3-oxosteroid 1-dehydrogenase [Nocardia seriolae]|uniref:3-oxosteroid 1-dehydrogenase n=2 Tax=Nocardia seriolae TaxID=37332 RepID=A0ABC8AW60_9NOCA|nr:3-oxosteroid 1-dehydrogenase [Nocardia seriolae]APA98209.1 3-oxosteroid 1-dehydrogenase [Nocardia seriolae]OJF80145.1 3-ketosteroid-delta-1-dehydrogenase [Nocardia seriolae]PSK33153.1 3-oxosteroid 1-dehydrogenase [Nocardia seriolae]QOW35913.1 3-oxosteroid 1-dehydrogenase [Nocardia seriolae]QUN16595.1 3-oxosteroid 1-dehydrogenase [Nocardia seriolae]
MLDDKETAGTFDLIVVGSGAAGMAAALTAARHGLSAVIVEKARHWGGSTARSGGGVWIPGNAVLRREAPADELEAARTYLKDIVGAGVSPERIDTFLDRGPEAFDFLAGHSPLRMRWVPGYSDYYPEAPGGRAHGRSVEPVPYDATGLGAELDTLEPDYAKAPRNVVVTQAEFRRLHLGLRNPRSPLTAIGIAGRWLVATVLRRRVLARGQALSAMLRAGLISANVPLWLDTPLVELCTEDGRVTGAVVLRDGREQVLTARRGVVVAAGGFEHNEVMRKQFQRQPIGTDWSVGAKANTGDGIRAGQAVGGAVEFMDDAWWGPSIPLPREAWFCLAERNLPGSVVVNARGERFMNECLPYVEAVHRMYGGVNGQGEGPGENLPAWLIFDQRYRNRYQFAGVPPRQPLPGRWFKSGALTRADSLPELAEKLGLPVEKFEATVSRFNEFAAAGADPDFGRGNSAYDNYYGDPRNHPNPNLGALESGPFYAAKLVPGDLGTKGGLVTDVHGRVLREDGTPIDGLYAAGNASAPVMGHTYAGPGATIGPALVFAYLSARHAAQ